MHGMICNCAVVGKASVKDKLKYPVLHCYKIAATNFGVTGHMSLQKNVSRTLEGGKIVKA